MNKQLRKKQLYIIFIILILLFLFSRKIVYAEFKESTEEEMHTSNISQFLIGAFGDFINRSLNSLGTDLSETEAKNLVYKKDDIEKNLLLKNQINVEEITSEDNANDDNKISEPGTMFLSNEVYSKTGESEEIYTTETEIPAIPLDIYTMSAGKSPILDINFWDFEENNENKIWIFIKNIVISCAHIFLYISIALIITMIIWRSIVFVYSVMTQQTEKVVKSKKIMDNMFSTILMVIGVYVLMTACTLLHDKVLNLIFKDSTTYYPIKVVVDNVYTFNSNAIGILKYMSLSSNVLHKFGWSIAYCIFSIVCFIYFVLMFIRMIFLGILSIVAPFTAVMKLSGLGEGKGWVNILFFKNWFKLYLRFTYIPVVIAFFVHIITGV